MVEPALLSVVSVVGVALVGALIALWRKVGDMCGYFGEIKGILEDYPKLKERVGKTQDMTARLEVRMEDHLKRCDRDMARIDNEIKGKLQGQK